MRSEAARRCHDYWRALYCISMHFRVIEGERAFLGCIACGRSLIGHDGINGFLFTASEYTRMMLRTKRSRGIIEWMHACTLFLEHEFALRLLLAA